jgi:WD40 repeat protein
MADGGRVLSGHSDGGLRLWEVATGKVVRPFGERHDGPVADCFVAPYDKQALTYGWDWTIRVWDLTTGQEVPSLRRKLDDPSQYRGVAFSPDGKRFISLHARDRVLRLWDVSSGKIIHRCELHSFFSKIPGAPMGVSISPDGRYAACGSFRGLVYLFRLPE